MIHLLDSHHLGSEKVIGLALIEITPNEYVMVDSGPESVFKTVVSAIEGLGIRPQNVRHLLLSHVHLDHSGGAWRWAQTFGTRVYVHPKGAPHLIDPERLVASATRIYGGKMDYLWGKVDKISPDKVIAVDDGAFLTFGSLTFQALYTPGHAQHHNVYWMPDQGALFTGDVAGVIIDDGPAIPPFPPPDIHLEAWKHSLDLIRTLNPASLYLTHCGKIDSPAQRLDELEQRLFEWADWMKEKLREGKSEAEIVPEFERFTRESLIAAGVQAEGLLTYEQADPAAMSVGGLIRYWRKYHPDQINAY